MRNPHPPFFGDCTLTPGKLHLSATKMTGRPGHWSEPGEYNILLLGSILVVSAQDSSALAYREFTQEDAMTISPFAAREGTSAPQWPNVKKKVVVTSFRPVTSSPSHIRCRTYTLRRLRYQIALKTLSTLITLIKEIQAFLLN